MPCSNTCLAFVWQHTYLTHKANKAIVARKAKYHPCLCTCGFTDSETDTQDACLVCLLDLKATLPAQTPVHSVDHSRGQCWRDVWRSCPRCWEAPPPLKTLCCLFVSVLACYPTHQHVSFVIVSMLMLAFSTKKTPCLSPASRMAVDL